MEIEVKLFTTLEKHGDGRVGNDGKLVLSGEKTLNELCELLRIPEKLGIVFLVNGRPQGKEYMLNEGDTVKIFPFLGGG